MIDASVMSMTDIIRLQNQLQQELTRRFSRSLLLVFSDIVGSTPYFARFGDAAGRQLQQLHFDLLTGSLSAEGGRIVDTSGDGAFAVLDSADAALRSIILFQKSLVQENRVRAPQHRLHVRMGIHWSMVLTDGNAVCGDAVNLCSRVAGSAQVGEVRLTRDALQQLSPEQRLHCGALGAVALKGLPEPIELLALEWRDPVLFPCRLHIAETNEVLELPQQDLVTFGRLAEHDGTRANDIVLAHPNAESARKISRWHLHLQRELDGLRVRTLSDSATEIDGQPLAKGVEVPVRAGTVIRVGGVLTLRFLGPNRPAAVLDPEATMLSTGVQSAQARS
jgi:class 3 adenylate cyclase